MKSLKELLAERTQLDAELSHARKVAADEGLRKVHELIAEFGYTAQQVFPWKPTATHVVPSYVDKRPKPAQRKTPLKRVAVDKMPTAVPPPVNQEGPFLAEMAAAAARAGALPSRKRR